MRPDNRTQDSVRAWSTARPDEISKRFHNMLMVQVIELHWLLCLFAPKPPKGKGQYNHHNGLQS